MKMKNKGKVYPSPSSSSISSSSSSTCSNGAGGGGGAGVDYLSVLKLLPAAIFALASILSLEDREVLAYLIMRSMKTTVSSAAASTTNQPSFSQKKPSKKLPNNCSSGAHKAPGLYCDCFDCYTSFWFRWDSSPNRELIHQAIEAFEDHLTSGESEKSKKNGKGKRRDKTARRLAADNHNNNFNKQVVSAFPGSGPSRPESSVLAKQFEVTEESSGSTVFVSAGCDVLPENEMAPVSSPERKSSCSAEYNEADDVSIGSSPVEEPTVVRRPSMAASATSCSTHKGLARKVLPDVLGLFNSRLWALWNPNV